MQDHTSQTENLDHDGSQDESFARRSSTQSVIAPSATQSSLIDDDDDGGGPDEKLFITIQSPAPNATVPILLSQSSFIALGVVTSTSSAQFDTVTVQFGNSAPRTASGTSNWTCTSGTITTSGLLTITARALLKGKEVAQDTRDVTVVVNDDVKPVVTITQPAVDGTPVKETNGVFSVVLRGTATDTMSGVRLVEYSLDGANFTGFAGTSPFPLTLNWETKIILPFQVKLQTIFVRAIDGNNNHSITTQRTVVTDKTGPTLDIKEPVAAQITLPDNGNGGATLSRLAGTVKDTQSGVQKVEWALDPPQGTAQFTPVKLSPTQNGAYSWSILDIAIPPPAGSLHTIQVRGVDGAGNVTVETITVTVAKTYPPQDPTVQEYFSSLVDFIVHRMVVQESNGASDRPLRVEDLTAALYQPFQKLLSADATLRTAPVHQLRICIEVLRQYVTKNGPLTGAALQVLQQAEAAYRLASYETLLKRIGTSFTEIRTARLAEEPARQALAQRLGFALRSQPIDDPQNPPTSLRALAIDTPSPGPLPVPEPDRLQQLLLQPGQFTEADLETLFGLVDTRRDPLQQQSTKPKLLDWQLQFLTAGWATQDDAAALPVIDPDVIVEVDLQLHSAAYFLWQARPAWVNGRLADLKTQRQAQANLLTGFDQIVSAILGPIADLLALDAQRAAGADIEPQLAQQQLTLAAFVHLMGLRKLAAAGTILLSEWDDVYSILVQVQKLRSFADWRAEEQAHNVVLGPDAFRIPDPGQALVPPAVSPEWRMTAQARQAWQETLQARINQQAALQQALLSVVDATEEDTLPLLRDALVSAIGSLLFPSQPQPLTVVADALTQRVLIDVTTSGYQKITRIAQAIQTLQSVLIAIRTGRLEMPTWHLNTAIPEVQANFAEEMRWMGAYGAWRSAMEVFLYPENFLLPTLRPPALPPDQLPSVPEEEERTHAFQIWINDLRSYAELTPEKARDLAQNYLTALQEHYKARNVTLLPLPPIIPSRPFEITEQYTPKDLFTLREKTGALINLATAGIDLEERLQHIPSYLREIFYFVPIALALQLQKSGQYLAALDWFRVVYAYDLPELPGLPGNERKIYYGLELEEPPTPDAPQVPLRNVFWLSRSLNPHNIVSPRYEDDYTRYDAYTRFVVMSLVRCLLEFADAEFTQDTNESLPRARSLYMQALDLLDMRELNPPPVPGLSPNPVLVSLEFHAQVNLAKLRSGRNIAGLQRQLELGADTGLVPATRTFHPTPYRYTVLIDRAKQLVTIAQQMEAAYLSALEKRDSEAYNLLKANQDLGLAQAGVQLQDLRVIEAAGSVVLADRQQERATYQVQTVQGFLDAGISAWEKALLVNYQEAAQARIDMAALDAVITINQAMTTAASGGFLGTGASGGFVAAGITSGAAFARAAVAADASEIEADMQANALHASIEQREREWTFQKGLAEKDVAISAQQVQLAKDHQNIVSQEEKIAQMQHDNAQDAVRFLANKFTNPDLYDWMSGVLRQVYSYFLQQASAVARLAQDQLAFERQDVAPAFIQHDYWQPTADSSGATTDRRGLTGSARLLQDIYQLDQFAFETNKRKLQLTKTFSLARLMPLEFQRFRDTGVLTFATPMQIFDRDFPGHYLRLIKRARTSVVALIPPNQGIRATLTTGGVSRVVINGDTFQTISVRRDPESVALTSPMNATGLFELDAQSDLLLPFEFTGVDTMWNLEMPKAANPFDYRTIADVLFTIEYTALSSLDYRQQVIQQLDRSVSADRPYSFRQQFPDQWYDLHNPDQTATPMAVSFTTTREDFPPNLENLAIQQVALYFILADGETTAGMTAQLRFTAQGASTPLGGEAAVSPEGIISTRLGNAAGWLPMLGQAPFGTWELAFSNTIEVRNLFENEVIADIIFVITASGRTPAWPV